MNCNNKVAIQKVITSDARVNFHGKSQTSAFFTDITSSSNVSKKNNATERKLSTIQTRPYSVVRSDRNLEQRDDEATQFAHRLLSEDETDTVETFKGQSIFNFKTSKQQTQQTNSVAHLEEKRKNSVEIESITPYQIASKTADDGNGSEDSINSDSDCSSVHSGKQEASKKHISMHSVSEGFFSARSVKQITSDNTLARLREQGSLHPDSLPKLLMERPNQYSQSMMSLHQEHRGMYRKWMLELCLGFNILLYGYGSKRQTMEGFRHQHCSDYHNLVINGFFPGISLRNILESITTECLNLDGMQMETDAQIDLIIKTIEDTGEVLFIFAHSIDGPMLQQLHIQQALSQLASSSNICMVASMDHINAPLLWSQVSLTKFAWLWYDVTTYQPYIEETSYENSLVLQQSGSLALHSMLNIFKSLTPNARSIFLLVAEYHMQHCSDQAYLGMAFQLLYYKCRESFLVNSDQTLRAQLTEFRDHKVIRSRKGPDGAEYVFLPVDSSTLSDFMAQASLLG